MRAVAALLCCIALHAQAESFEAKVIMVMDGDTVMVLRGKQKIKVRLANIDAPEKTQAYGQQARDSLQELVGKKQVRIDSRAADKYGRVIGMISLDGRDINREQVSRGMAWENSNFHSDKVWVGLQKEAQQLRRGLWSQDNPQAPWEWRLRHVTGEASRLREQPPAAGSSLVEMQQDNIGRRKEHPSTQPAVDPACGKKRLCSQMASCDEAHYYLGHCGVKTLDRNKDGIPCESLCAGKK